MNGEFGEELNVGSEKQKSQSIPQPSVRLYEERRVRSFRRYQIIYADPPWNYRDKANAGKRGAAYKYVTTDTETLCRLPIPSIAGDNCALFMWATGPMMPDAQRLMAAWGFEYKTVAFNWVKTNKKSGTDFLGMGNYTRANSEFVLLGTRGRLTRLSASVRQIIRSPILRHSEKPAEIRVRIVQLFGPLSRIELFARERTEGWDAWGNEVEADVQFTASDVCRQRSTTRRTCVV